MKTLLLSLLAALATVFASCQKESDAITGQYDYIHFERWGGGENTFDLYPTTNPDEIEVVVSSFEYRDIAIRFTLMKNNDNATCFSDFYNALNNQMPINGDFKESTLLTGTWANVYVMTNGKKTEITNIHLRESILQFEEAIANRTKTINKQNR